MAVSARLKMDAGSRGTEYGVRGPGVWKTRGGENAEGVDNTRSGGKHRIWWKTRGLKLKTRGMWKKQKQKQCL